MSSRSSTRVPTRWPQSLLYLTEPRYHPSVPENVRKVIQSTSSRTHSSTQSFPVSIQTISTPTHPARGQSGLFAVKKIPPRTFILDYIGEIHCDDRPDSDYDLSLYRSADNISVGIDAKSVGNEARFVNDYRGIKPKPNVVFQERRTERGELRMSIWSGSEAIKKGDELLVSYGKSWWRTRHNTEAERTELPDSAADAAS